MGMLDDKGALSFRDSLATLCSREDMAVTQSQTGSTCPPCLVANLPTNSEDMTWVAPSGTSNSQTPAIHLMILGKTWSKVV